MAELLVRDLMTEKVYTVRPEDTVSELVQLLNEIDVRHMPVIDEDGTLVGLVSHRDLLRSAAAERADVPLSMGRELMRRTLVGEVMNEDVETIEADASIRRAAEIMLENKYGCLPVVDGTRLVGILTEADFVRYLGERSRLAAAG